MPAGVEDWSSPALVSVQDSSLELVLLVLTSIPTLSNVLSLLRKLSFCNSQKNCYKIDNRPIRGKVKTKTAYITFLMPYKKGLFIIWNWIQFDHWIIILKNAWLKGIS